MDPSNAKFTIIRLGKDSVSDIKRLDSLHGEPSSPISLTVYCTQVPFDVDAGFYALLYLGSDNSKGIPTAWAQGLRALGKVVKKEGGPKYGDSWKVEVEVNVIFPESVNKKDFLAKAPTAYYWFSSLPVIGLSSFSNQTVQLIKLSEPRQNINSLLYAINEVHPGIKKQIENRYSELSDLFDYEPPTTMEGSDGFEETMSSGWDEYPLDSVFVRKEQRALSEVVKRINADRFILDPDFQRDFVWPPKKQSRLIESCLMRIPLPVFYVAEAKDGRIIVVDGLQRLTTFTRYLNDEFVLSKLGKGREDAPQENRLLGKRFSELPVALKERIEDTQLTLYILDAKAPERAKLDIFERVNSGQPLARQQMRNCLFSGPATRWLRVAAESKAFLNTTGRSLDKKTMRDREVINRFCAFRLLGVDQYKGDMDDFLARALEKMNNLGSHELDKLNQNFIWAMDVNYLLFGRHAFRKSLAANAEYADRSVINIALFDVCSTLLSDLEESAVKEHANKLRNKIGNLLNDIDFFQAISYGTNGIVQVETRFDLMETTIAQVI